jgi:putative membrane protein
MRFILRMLISAAVIFGVAYFSHGALLPELGWQAALALAVVLALVSAIIKPIVGFLALPITIVTLGLFSLVINALMLLLAELIVGLPSPGFLSTLLAALLIAILTSVLTSLVDHDDGGRRRR